MAKKDFNDCETRLSSDPYLRPIKMKDVFDREHRYVPTGYEKLIDGKWHIEYIKDGKTKAYIR